MAAVVLALSACDTDEGDAGHGSHAGGSGGTGGVGGHGGEAGAGGSGGTGGAGGEGGEGGSVPTVEIASIRILPGEAEIVDHETVAFSAEALDEGGNPIEGVTFAWRSSDAAIASITSDGVATGHRPGSVVITAEAEGVEGTASLRVNAAEVAEATIEPETLQLPLGEERRLVVTLRDAEGRELFGRTIAWSSTDPAIASVDEDGVVTGVDLGEAEIVAEVDGFTLRASVYVVLRFRSIHAGGYHYCGLDAQGHAWCWGYNSADFELGQPDMTDPSPIPLRVSAPSGMVVPVSFADLQLGEYFGCGRTEEGRLYCWGYNDSGQIGNGTFQSVGRPMEVSLEEDVEAYALGYFAVCARTVSGVYMCWGDNYSGQLGSENVEALVPTPFQADLGDVDFAGLFMGHDHVCGLEASGKAWCWGDNRQGQLANDEVDSSAEPVEVPGDHLFRQLALTSRSTCGLTLEGEVICWGTMLDDAFWWEPVLLDVNAGTVDDEE